MGLYKGNELVSGMPTIDTELKNSPNPVQNRVVKNAIDGLGTRVGTLEDNQNNIVTLTSADNLDNVTDITKKYYVVYGNYPTNSPTTDASFSIEVKYDGAKTESNRRQIVTSKAQNVRYERTYANGVWSDWRKEDFNRIGFVGARYSKMETSYTLPTGVWTKVCTITGLPYGQYLATGTCTFKSNGSGGYRNLKVSNKPTGSDNATTVNVASASTSYEEVLNGSIVFTLSETYPDVNLWLSQASGSDVTLSYPQVSVIRIN